MRKRGMLSYQHMYHAGNLADVQKHAALAWVLDYMTAKDKPITYMETHAGRGLYDLGAPEALKTGEARAGIARAEALFDPAHPYRRALGATRAAHGAQAYPGSPLIAAHLLRATDTIALAELHPRENAALHAALGQRRARIVQQDGFAMTQALCPPNPRRGVMMIDPSYEVKSEYDALPKFLREIARKWNVGVVMLWYPLLVQASHTEMIARIRADHPQAVIAEARFPPIRAGHKMVGTGLAVLNAPWGFAQEAARIGQLIQDVTQKSA